MEKKYFLLHSKDEKMSVSLNASDLIETGMSRSSAYRAIKTGYLPPEKHGLLQFRIFGDMPGWDGWKILPGKLVDPKGRTFEPKELVNLADWHQIMMSFETT